MPHLDCNQQDKIDSIARTVDKMERGQERLIELLEKVANQDARLDHLEEYSERTYRDVNELYGRVRDVELNQASYGPENRLKMHEMFDDMAARIGKVDEKLNTIVRFHEIATSKKAIYIYAAVLAIILFGFASDMWNHWEWVKTVWHFYATGV